MAFGGFSVAAIIDTLAQGYPLTDVLPIPAVLAPLWFFGAVRPGICIAEREVIVRNPLWTRRIHVDTIRDAQPGYFGVTIRRRTGRPVTAWAVQQPNASAGSGHTRAAKVAAAIREVATRPDHIDEQSQRFRTVVDEHRKIRRVSE